jgi:hypothetical protein
MDSNLDTMVSSNKKNGSINIVTDDNEHGIYTWNISNLIGKEYLEMSNDLIRMITIQVVIQFMLFAKNPSATNLINGQFFEIILYVAVAVCFYWLIVKKFIIIE